MAKIMDLSDEEADFILLLKNYQTAEAPERKSFLLRKINDQTTKSRSIEMTAGIDNKLKLESMYLLNPKCMLVQIALNVESYRTTPRLLCAPLNIELSELISILDLIEKNGFISRGEDPLTIKEVRPATFHIDSNELMRIHQYLMKTLIPGRLQETSEELKKSFLVTFNLDEASYKECIDKFDGFIDEIRKISGKCRVEGVYQLSFDFFKWC